MHRSPTVAETSDRGSRMKRPDTYLRAQRGNPYKVELAGLLRRPLSHNNGAVIAVLVPINWPPRKDVSLGFHTALTKSDPGAMKSRIAAGSDSYH